MFLQVVGFLAVWTVFAFGIVHILHQHLNVAKKDNTDAR